jgi:hypothetical protein
MENGVLRAEKTARLQAEKRAFSAATLNRYAEESGVV